ncbi:hypothetical protein Gohar_025480 [Gossypium harknessii]|uniref:DUF7745 domain-containing protein n=1 Tax=Gossypium harknessii TaxID=34285 RepID=A0A7J9IB02_9ROSI|nr:hypothetical protein [Gossypium harknessii]
MERGFLDKVEDNAAVRIWSERMQQEKGDSFAEGYVSELWDFTRISVTQNNLQDLKEIWDQWGDEIRQLFCSNYGDLPYLLDIKVDKHLFRALTQYWNPAYSCFTFGKKRVDIFALSIYGLVVFPKVLEHIDEAVSDLFDRLDKGVTPIPAILAETFRSLNASRRVGERRFIGCAQLLLEEDVKWKAPWMVPDEILYRCWDFDWVPLLEFRELSDIPLYSY